MHTEEIENSDEEPLPEQEGPHGEAENNDPEIEVEEEETHKEDQQEAKNPKKTERFIRAMQQLAGAGNPEADFHSKSSKVQKALRKIDIDGKTYQTSKALLFTKANIEYMLLNKEQEGDPITKLIEPKTYDEVWPQA